MRFKVEKLKQKVLKPEVKDKKGKVITPAILEEERYLVKTFVKAEDENGKEITVLKNRAVMQKEPVRREMEEFGRKADRLETILTLMEKADGKTS